MVRKRIPFVTRPDPAYAAGLSQGDPGRRMDSPVPPAESGPGDLSAELPAVPLCSQPLALSRAPRDDLSTQIDVRVTALKRQEAALLDCGIIPAQVIRAAMRRAVKDWEISPDFIPPSDAPRAKHPSWVVRTSVAVPAAIFDRLQAERDPLGVCSRWSLVRGQLEPLVWQEIDRLLASFTQDDAPPEPQPARQADTPRST